MTSTLDPRYLEFDGDEEFGRLHAAIRLLLPIIPALSASTPILDGEVTGYLDTRLETYRHNQDRIPSIAGRVIPERAFSEDDYRQRIFDPIERDIRSQDPDGVLDVVFLNFRGAIARFDLSGSLLGDVLVLASIVMWGCFTVFGKHLGNQLQPNFPGKGMVTKRSLQIKAD